MSSEASLRGFFVKNLPDKFAEYKNSVTFACTNKLIHYEK